MTRDTVRARDLMTVDVRTVPDVLSVRELSQLLEAWEVSGVPVVDEGGLPVGVVSVTDVARTSGDDSVIVTDRSNPDFFVRGWDESFNPEDLRRLHLEDETLRVRDIMTPTVYDVAADAPIPEVVDLMLSAHVHRVLVRDDGRIVGIISTFDVLGHLSRVASEVAAAAANV